jgi:glycosyltransferase involved in cell wall biosynthesis
MKVLYVIGSMELGGAEQHLLRVSSALRAQGYAPEVFALTIGGPLTQAFADNGIPVHGVRLPQWLTRFLRHERAVAWAGLIFSSAALWLLYWRRRPQVAHFFLPAAYIVGGVVALFGPRMRRVMSRRSLNLYQDKHKLFRRIEHWLHPRMDLVCGNSKAVVRDLQAEGIEPARLRLIYNGMPLERFEACLPRAQVRASLGLSDDCLVFAIVANLIPYKGHDDLIDALGLIKDRLPADWACLCIGRDDGIGPSLRARAEALNIHDHIRFLGSRKDVPDLLCSADIGVLCSHEEGFSNAVLEGMAAGLPMVVTDVGGNAEAVVQGNTGLVVPPKSPEALSTALLTMAEHPHRSEFGARGLDRVTRVFSMEACVRGYRQIYEETLPT